jgi:predicted nucleotidyltransferase component of viral defense system
MLQTSTIEPGTLDALKKLMKIPSLQENMQTVSMEDIMAMKLAAITKRGSKKDFVDIYFLLKEFSIQQMLENFKKKYSNAETYMTVKSLTYFADADLNEMPVLLKDKNVKWEEMKEVIRKAVKSVT